MIEKTGIIGRLDLPEKAEHTRESQKTNPYSKIIIFVRL